MSEEYLLAWSEHHATFFSAMSELVSGEKNCHPINCTMYIAL